LLTTWCRTSYGRSSSPCCRPRRARPTAAGTVPSPIATASPRSSLWPAARHRGGSCQPNSSAAARRRPAGAASPNGPTPACSTNSTWRLGPPWPARPGGLVTGERGHHERAGQAWGDHGGANPVDRGKPGSKLHLVCDATGFPLTAAVTAATINDTTLFEAVVDDVPAVRTPSGRRRTRPVKLHADKGYASRANRAWLRRRGIRPRIARRGWSPRPGLAATAGGSSGRCHG
jgi:Transposase DDE domain